MSFYDDASLVFLPSGGAGKDGKAYSIKPVPEYGNELVTNGDYSDGGTDWSIYTSGSSNVVFTDVATINIDGSNSNVGIYQENVFSNSVQYRIVLRVKGSSSFDAEVVESQAAATQQTIGVISLTTSYQDFVFTHTANGTNDIFIHRLYTASSANESIIIDNVSVKEITVGDGDFTFSRGSNLTATRIDSNGLIEKGRENLLLQSNQFDTTWTTSNSSVTSGQSGYDGSSDAWLFDTNIANGFIRQGVTFSGVSTFSIYAKSGTADGIYIEFAASTFPNLKVDLSSQSFISSTNIIDYNIEDVGNGWSRVSFTFSGSHIRVNIKAVDGSGSVTDGTIYIQDAQVEQGLVATEYIESGATTGLAGILEDSPRFDYSGGASCPSLLLEPSRSNLMTYSEIFQGSGSEYWRVFDNGTIEPNYGISPEGVNNSTKIGTSGGGNDFVYNSITILSGTTYTLSCFVKNIDATESLIYGINTANNDLTWNGSTLTNVVGGDFEQLDNGWYRIFITTTSTSTNALTRIYSDRNGETGSIEIYGFQIEQGSYPTSYIPNHSGGSVTREADFATKTGLTSSINSTEGTMFLDFKALASTLPTEYSYFSMSDGTFNNRIGILQSVGSTNEVRAFCFVGGTKVFDFNNSVTDITTQTKVALRYANNAFDLFINGAKVGTDNSGSIFSADTLDRVSFSEIGTIAKPFKGKVSQALIFQEALSNADLEILTGATSYESFAAMAAALNYTTYE